MTLAEQRREKITKRLKTFFKEHFDEELSDFRAAQVLDFFLETLGPDVYNQGVQDARRFMQEKLDDLDGEVYKPAGT